LATSPANQVIELKRHREPSSDWLEPLARAVDYGARGYDVGAWVSYALARGGVAGRLPPTPTDHGHRVRPFPLPMAGPISRGVGRDARVLKPGVSVAGPSARRRGGRVDDGPITDVHLSPKLEICLSLSLFRLEPYLARAASMGKMVRSK